MSHMKLLIVFLALAALLDTANAGCQCGCGMRVFGRCQVCKPCAIYGRRAPAPPPPVRAPVPPPVRAPAPAYAPAPSYGDAPLGTLQMNCGPDGSWCQGARVKSTYKGQTDGERAIDIAKTVFGGRRLLAQRKVLLHH